MLRERIGAHHQQVVAYRRGLTGARAWPWGVVRAVTALTIISTHLYPYTVPRIPIQRDVFVCAMWLTGFDVPSLSNMYLDKPLRAHTLMQAIARASRLPSCGRR